MSRLVKTEKRRERERVGTMKKEKRDKKRKHKSPVYKNKRGGIIIHLANITIKKITKKEILQIGIW